MKITVYFFALLGFIALIIGQAFPAQADAPVVKSIGVGTAYDGGKLTGIATTFSPKVHKFYSVMTLGKIEQGSRYKAAWVVVDAAGMKNYKLLEYQVPGMPVNSLQTSLSLPRDFPVGKYRVDWTRDNKPFRSVAFSVK